jgi:hypothetical protein
MVASALATREDVWEGLANQFLDTETRHFIPGLALMCVEAGLSTASAFDAWAYEVTPAVFFNLWKSVRAYTRARTVGRPSDHGSAVVRVAQSGTRALRLTLLNPQDARGVSNALVEACTCRRSGTRPSPHGLRDLGAREGSPE